MVETAVRTLTTGLGFVEGPTLLSDGDLIVVSLDHQRIYAIQDQGASAAVEFEFAPNGATLGPDGVVYVAGFCGAWPAREDCRGDGGVFAWRPGREATVVTSAPQAPNDLCFGPDGLLYVTDPIRGGNSGRVWTVDVERGTANVIAAVDWYPNGIGFDSDDVLWVADTVGRRLLRLDGDGSRAEAHEGFTLAAGKPDGFAFDNDGHVIVAAPGTPEHPEPSVQLWSIAGELEDVLLEDTDSYYTNVALDAGGTLFVTEAKQGRVLALAAPCAGGLPLHPFRSTRG